MRVIEATYHNFETINSRQIIGKAVTTKECSMSTGYRGSGKPIVTETKPAGTPVGFCLRESGNHSVCWLTIIFYAPSDKHGRVELRANHDIYGTLEEAAKKLHIESVIK